MLWALLPPLAVFAALSVLYVLQNPLETDEGFYGIAARSASEGRWVYRDFAFNQTHLFPYLHGLLLRAVGFGLFSHRALCAGYAALALLLIAAAALTPRRGFSFGLLTWTLALSPFLVARLALGQSFSLAALFLLSAGAISLLRLDPSARRWWLAVLGALAIGCKLTVAPAVAVLWGYEAFGSRSRQALLAPLFASAVVFLPVILIGPEQWWFWNVGFHLGLEGIDFRGAGAYRDHLQMAPGVLLLGLLVTVLAWRRGLQRTPAFFVVLAALGAWALQLPLPSTQGEYAILFLPLLALGTAELLTQLEPPLRFRYLLCGVPLLGLLTGLPPRDPLLRTELNQVAQRLREEVPGSQAILTPLPVVALQSGHRLVPRLEMGPFCLTSELDDLRAVRLGVHTPASLMAAVEGGPGAIVLTSQPSTWDFYWSIPSLAPVPEAARAALFARIARVGFQPVLRNGQFTLLLPDPAGKPAAPFWKPPR